ncbi:MULTISPECIES: pantoate--beta-alanine ligase [Jeotgalicoccus]|uniref:pantoate--beta-alanine ligase n=1 Tax=Jeotgalicoccus TaxID=227979 RepID=UPI0003FC6A16|nr:MULTISPECIES: pantoate--beta-alanine ligase [Jeotgalicoccus]
MKHSVMIDETREILSEYKGQTVGLVPTMGALHEGHGALIQAAKEACDIVVVSIFLNPLQFGPDEDFESYPKDLKGDLALCESYGVDLVFAPSEKVMYPCEMEFNIGIKSMANLLDGVKRPGHFEGVVTVVSKLFNIIQPAMAFFGEKDRQQLMIIKRYVQDFNVPVKIQDVPTKREESGLARSSRNVNLTATEYQEAPNIYQALKMASLKIKDGETNVDKIQSLIKIHIEQNTSGSIDDLAIYRADNLGELNEIDSDVIIFIAVQFSKARLIDNLYVSI